jgi:hypothetical protein
MADVLLIAGFIRDTARKYATAGDHQKDRGYAMDHAKESAALVTLTVAIFAAGCWEQDRHLEGGPKPPKDGVSCPQQRGAYCNSSCPPKGGSYSCMDDSNCTEGVNGRCGAFTFDNPSPMCSYDECFNDSDCEGGVPCDCRPSGSSFEPNVCLTLSNCRIDSNCGPGGYCSPSNEGIWYAYYCHTPGETCTNDGDCPMGQPTCGFDTSSGHWSCVLNIPPP